MFSSPYKQMAISNMGIEHFRLLFVVVFFVQKFEELAISREE